MVVAASAGTGGLVRVERIMNSSKYQPILAQNLQASVRQLKKPFSTTTTQSTDPNPQKHGFTSQSPDLKPIECLWGDLKRVVHWRCPRNLTDLERFCKEERAHIATSRCAMLIDSYPKRLSALIQSKGASTKY
uniref:Tc1-like transposase DDE domain-containing protein n=1 Tax=Esox lucius TaxID=8010 RepID=A0AAY5KD36_ESOLU